MLTFEEVCKRAEEACRKAARDNQAASAAAARKHEELQAAETARRWEKYCEEMEFIRSATEEIMKWERMRLKGIQRPT